MPTKHIAAASVEIQLELGHLPGVAGQWLYDSPSPFRHNLPILCKAASHYQNHGCALVDESTPLKFVATIISP